MYDAKGDIEGKSRLSDAWLTRDELQLMTTAFRPPPNIPHLRELGFASDEINRSGRQQRRRQRETHRQSCVIEFIVGCLTNVCDEPIPALRHRLDVVPVIGG